MSRSEATETISSEIRRKQSFPKKLTGAIAKAGVVDGVLLDWWSDDDSRLRLVKLVRQAIGDKYLIIANDRTTPADGSIYKWLLHGVLQKQDAAGLARDRRDAQVGRGEPAHAPR